MRNIDSIMIHCSATREGEDFRASDIERWHKERGFKDIGYNYVICIDGTVEVGRNTTKNGAHCNRPNPEGISYNKSSIGICYIGGLDRNGKPKDTRTKAQKKAMTELITNLMEVYHNITDILGHRDASPDLNGDGVVAESEWEKDCPCFDVRAEYPISVCKG